MADEMTKKKRKKSLLDLDIAADPIFSLDTAPAGGWSLGLNQPLPAGEEPIMSESMGIRPKASLPIQINPMAEPPLWEKVFPREFKFPVEPPVQPTEPPANTPVPGLLARPDTGEEADEEKPWKNLTMPPSLVPGGMGSEMDIERARRIASENEETSLRNREDKLAIARIISENMDRIGRGLTGAAGHVGVNELEPLNLRGLEFEQARTADILRPGERALLGQAGINVPPGVRRSYVTQVTPSIASVKGREAMMGMQRARYERVPPTMLEPIKKFKTGLDSIDRIEENYKKAKTGPVSGRVQFALGNVGIGDPDTIVTNANIIKLMADYVFSVSGKQVSDKEFARLSRMFPNAANDEGQFRALLANVKTMFENELQNSLDILETQNYDVERTRAWALGGGGMTGTTEPTAGTVNAIWKDGTKTPIADTPENRQKAKDRGYTIEGE